MGALSLSLPVPVFIVCLSRLLRHTLSLIAWLSLSLYPYLPNNAHCHYALSARECVFLFELCDGNSHSDGEDDWATTLSASRLPHCRPRLLIIGSMQLARRALFTGKRFSDAGRP